MDKINLQLNVTTKWIIALILLTTFAACSNKDKVEVKNANGIVIESYYVSKKDKTKKIGVYQKFYDDGKIAESINYNSDGEQDGEHTSYFPNGKIMIKEEIKKNTNHGKYVSYYEDGNIELDGYYKNNKMDSIWKSYYPNQKNKLRYEATFKEGKFDGPYKEYFPNGNLMVSGNKIEIMDGMDVFDGEALVYDSLVNNKLIRKLQFQNGRQTAKEEIN